MLTIAHRGASGYEPENTLAAFTKALEMDAGGIELDVHLSADDEIIVIHDETLDRTTDGNGKVNHLTSDQIKSFHCNNGEEVPTLAEVFDLVDRRCMINIEIKAFEATFPVARLIEKYVSEKNWPIHNFLVSSFDWVALQKLRDEYPEIQIGVLTATDIDLAIAFAKVIKAETIHPYFHLLNRENVALMKQNGLKVYTWTINEPEDIVRIKPFKVDGIITDFPDRI